MASTGLHGPHALTEASINQHVGQSIGAYALGDSSATSFIVRYVGRSDTDLNDRLKDWIGKYKEFKYGHLDSRKAAFDHECRMYHDFGESKSLDNDIHPDRPNGSGWKCPHCTIFG